MQIEPLVIGRNSISALLRQNAGNIKKIFYWGDTAKGDLKKLYNMAKQNLPASAIVTDRNLVQPYISKEGQGVAALLKRGFDHYLGDFDDLLAEIDQRQEMQKDIAPIVVLDQIQDAHNLGAIIRNAACFNISTVILPKDNQVHVTSIVTKVASGGMEFVRLIPVTNLARALDQLKQHGYWLVGTTMEATTSVYQERFDYPVAMIMGNEGSGLRPLTKKKCDKLIRIEMGLNLDSLNVSVASGIIMSQIHYHQK